MGEIPKVSIPSMDNIKKGTEKILDKATQEMGEHLPGVRQDLEQGAQLIHDGLDKTMDDIASSDLTKMQMLARAGMTGNPEEADMTGLGNDVNSALGSALKTTGAAASLINPLIGIFIYSAGVAMDPDKSLNSLIPDPRPAINAVASEIRKLI